MCPTRRPTPTATTTASCARIGGGRSTILPRTSRPVWSPARQCWTSAAVPGPSRSTSRHASRPVGCSASTHRPTSSRPQLHRSPSAASPTSTSSSATSIRSNIPMRSSMSCTRTRCCNTLPTRSRRCARCDASAGPMAWSRSVTASTGPSPGIRATRASTGGSTSTARSPKRTAASRTRAAGSARGRSLPASAPSPRPRRPGATRRSGAFVVGRPVGRTHHDRRRSPHARRTLGLATSDDLVGARRGLARLGRRAERLVRGPPRRGPRDALTRRLRSRHSLAVREPLQHPVIGRDGVPVRG